MQELMAGPSSGPMAGTVRQVAATPAVRAVGQAWIGIERLAHLHSAGPIQMQIAIAKPTSNRRPIYFLPWLAERRHVVLTLKQPAPYGTWYLPRAVSVPGERLEGNVVPLCRPRGGGLSEALHEAS